MTASQRPQMALSCSQRFSIAERGLRSKTDCFSRWWTSTDPRTGPSSQCTSRASLATSFLSAGTKRWTLPSRRANGRPPRTARLSLQWESLASTGRLFPASSPAAPASNVETVSRPAWTRHSAPAAGPPRKKNLYSKRSVAMGSDGQQFKNFCRIDHGTPSSGRLSLLPNNGPVSCNVCLTAQSSRSLARTRFTTRFRFAGSCSCQSSQLLQPPPIYRFD
mmetsp:Transcript_10947/g.34849  ORF Transcript_10947/g.34849 Transcript_10947/m.34849 type:complete len:220 (-) Transcript_10947:213-872(-)